MNSDEIHRILADEKTITPSAGFSESVMQAVAKEAVPVRQAARVVTPRELRFPWARALPGLLALFFAVVATVWNGIGALGDPEMVSAFAEQARQLSAVMTNYGLQWVAVAAVVTVVAMLLPSMLLSAGGAAEERFSLPS